jgi:Kef-type K+ transport system membrane component KefB
VKKVAFFSILLIIGLVISQFIPADAEHTRDALTLLTMVALSFIMIHVGYEFELDRSRPGAYAWDAIVAFTAAGLPWIFCATYFVFVMMPRGLWSHGDAWKESLLMGLFAAPTSAGVLFSMLAAAGLSATWVFRKARVLAIFDDLGTILLIIPLKMILVGVHWQLGAVVIVLLALLWIAWRYLHEVNLPVSWPWVLAYSVGITVLSHGAYIVSKVIDPNVPVHLEVLLPAFVLGCVLCRPAGAHPHIDDAVEGHQEGPESPREQQVATIVSAVFMVLVGLSIPAIRTDGPVNHSQAALKYAGAGIELIRAKDAFPGWGVIGLHVAAITLIANLGKMFCALCYRREASWRERLALGIGMYPRGEVGAGVLVISLSYGMGGPALTVAVLSLALNLLCTGLFIMVVKKLLRPQ